ncbi:MAG TPA: lysylphosphatidylglycerol synthase transmembrane domain-containing protein [Polyangiaceae bacterium]
MKADGARRYLRYALAAVLFAGCAVLVYRRRDLFASVANLSAATIAVILCSKFAVQQATAYRFKLLAKLFGMELTPREWMGLTAVTILYGRLLPARLGVLPRAYYLKKKYDFDYASYVSLFASLTVVDMFLCASVATVVCILTGVDAVVTRLFAAALGFTVLGSVALVAAARYWPALRWQRLNRAVTRFRAGFALYARDRKGAARVLVATLVAVLARAFAMWTCFWGIAADVPLAAPLLISLGAQLTLVVSLTPGNFGVTEATIIGLGTLLGVPLEVGVSAATVSRLSSLLVQVVLGLFYSQLLFGSISRPVPNQEPLDR